MGKFKVGDRVRATRSTDNVEKGEIYTVSGYARPTEIGRWVMLDGIRGWSDDGSYQEGYFEPATITIQAGRYYITRDGRKVGPMRRWSDESRHCWEADDDELPYIWADNGTEIDSDIDDSADLVAETDEPPAEPQSTKEILDELEAWIAEQDAIKAAGKGGTAGFTVPVCAYDDEPGWYAAELGRAYADGYAAGLRAAA